MQLKTTEVLSSRAFCGDRESEKPPSNRRLGCVCTRKTRPTDCSLRLTSDLQEALAAEVQTTHPFFQPEPLPQLPNSAAALSLILVWPVADVILSFESGDTHTQHTGYPGTPVLVIDTSCFFAPAAVLLALWLPNESCM